MIELIDLTKSFSGYIALNKLNLFIQEGEIFGIIGKSGAGKSTLLRTINLLEKPDSGSVILDNQEINALKTKELAKALHKTAMIFQHFNLLATKTVFENIALPARIQGMSEEAISEKIHELLNLVGLDDKKEAYPAQLSGGQKQRVAIARALVTSPKILLCDEATSALDPETTNSILDLLQKINQIYGITIVLITHEMEVIRRICHRLGIMEQGELIEVNSLAGIFDKENSKARAMLYKQLSPELPPCLAANLSQQPNHKPLLRLFFQGNSATIPFISQTSRDLHIDINILLANIDRFDTTTCGVLIVELTADNDLLNRFIDCCNKANLTVEILGYVTNDVL